jgi:hypothetical protein
VSAPSHLFWNRAIVPSAASSASARSTSDRSGLPFSSAAAYDAGLDPADQRAVAVGRLPAEDRERGRVEDDRVAPAGEELVAEPGRVLEQPRLALGPDRVEHDLRAGARALGAELERAQRGERRRPGRDRAARARPGRRAGTGSRSRRASRALA